MTELEKEAVTCLQHVRFPPASWDKRFARSMFGLWQMITDKEAAQVWRLFKRYRRQIVHPRKAELLWHAEKDRRPEAAIRRTHEDIP